MYELEQGTERHVLIFRFETRTLGRRGLVNESLGRPLVHAIETLEFHGECEQFDSRQKSAATERLEDVCNGKSLPFLTAIHPFLF